MNSKKTILSALKFRVIALSLLFGMALTLSAKELYVGNIEIDMSCSGKYSFRKSEPMGAAIKLKADDIKYFTGAGINKIVLFNSCTSAATSLKVFVAENLDDAVYLNETEVAATDIKKGWNIVDLSSAVEVPADKDLYIGYFVQSSWSQIGANDAVNVESYIFKPGKDEDGNDVPAVWTSAPEAFAIYAVLGGDALPDDDVALSVTSSVGDLMTADEGSLSFAVKNMGTTVVNALSVKCELGDGKTLTKEFDNLNIEYLKSKELTIDGIKYSSKGYYTIAVSAEKVNGNDDYKTDDNSANATAKVFDEFVERTILLEFNSTEKCTNCPSGHELVDRVVESSKAKIVEVSHHIGFYTDQFTLPSDEQYMVFYNDKSSWAPAIMIDRTNWHVKGYGKPVTPGPVFGVGSDNNATVISDILDREAAKPAYSTLNLELNVNDRTLDIKVNGKGLIDLKQDTRLTVFVTEDNLYTNTQAGWNNSAKGTYYHHFVNRAVLTDVWGDKVDLVAGFEKSYSYTVPDEYNIDNLNVAAFVSAFNPDDFNDCQVYNAVGQQVKDHTFLANGGDDNVAVIDVDDEKVEVFANSNDKTLSISGNYSAGRIYSISGEVVMTLNGGSSVSVANLNRGIYIVELTAEIGAVGRTKIIL